MSAAQKIVEALNATKSSLDAALTRIEIDVTELKRLIGQGEPIPPDVVEQILTQIGSLKTAIDKIDPVPEFPIQG